MISYTRYTQLHILILNILNSKVWEDKKKKQTENSIKVLSPGENSQKCNQFVFFDYLPWLAHESAPQTLHSQEVHSHQFQHMTAGTPSLTGCSVYGSPWLYESPSWR